MVRHCLCAAALAVGAPAAMPHPLQLSDVFRLHRISDPHVSPDGKSVVYVVSDVDRAENRSSSALWMVPAGGGQGRPLTHTSHHDAAPRWSPDGRWIAFESDRAGRSQIWILSLGGGEPRQLTHLATDAGQPEWSPDGSQLAFVSAVFPEFSARPPEESDRLNRELIESRAKNKVKARLYTELLYRHWDTWGDGRRRHVFVLPLRQGSPQGAPRDVTAGDRDAVPTSTTFSAGDDFTFSPDGTELAYTAAPLPTRTDAWSTNHDIVVVSLTTGERRNLTTNPAADGYPRYSPDGKWLAYRAQKRPGFEADRWELMLLNRSTGERRSLTPEFDSSVGRLQWTADSAHLVFDAATQGTEGLWTVPVGGGAVTALLPGLPLPGPAGEGPQSPVAGSNSDDFTVSASGDVVFVQSSFAAPNEIFRLHHGAVQPVTHHNAALLSRIERSAVESVGVRGAGGDVTQMWIMKPPGFAPGHRYPLVFWAHGGPQGQWNNGWSFRWNPAAWAAQGYVIAMPNPHGSTGFGQKFTDEISRDWGGEPFQDLMACLAYLKTLPYVDASRMAAAGASYGGYMMNWFEGHTTEFRTLVTHDGVFDFTSMYGTTDELWFEEHEHGQPWTDPDFEKFSPHRFAARFQTPMLIIHNQLDFRVPISQGEALFTTLQRRGIPSEFLSFPDEGHWVLKPANSALWHETIFEWLAKYLKS